MTWHKIWRAIVGPPPHKPAEEHQLEMYPEEPPPDPPEDLPMYPEE